MHAIAPYLQSRPSNPAILNLSLCSIKPTHWPSCCNLNLQRSLQIVLVVCKVGYSKVLQYRFLNMKTLYFLILACIFELNYCGKEEEEGVKYANKCEVCKIVSAELVDKLTETGKTNEVIETGYSVDQKGKKKTKYKSSELRLVETLENVCERILQYNIHKERTDSTRFAKGMSQTFQTLHGLVNKGVKVELGMPYELWDKPSAEITNLKTQCETLIEDYEDDIEEWYFNQQQNSSLQKFLCTDRMLKNDDDSCLYEKEKPEKGETKEEL